ncbi:vascular endothelial zinc finger 1 isoform X1, partial [Silurus asotus]
HHQHQLGPNSLLPLLNAEPHDHKPIMPIQLDQKPPVSSADHLKDSMGGGTGGGGGGGHGGGGGGIGAPMAIVKKEPKSKTPFICGYCNKAFRDSYHLRRHESCHTGVKMVSRPKKTAQTTAPTMVPLLSSMTRENNANPSYILTTAATSASGAMVPTSTIAACQPSAPKKPAKPVKKNHGCEMCGKAFRDVYHLNRHKLSHSDEKPFECPICQQRFKRKDRMTYHVRSHDGGVHKPYVCSVCGKGFSRPDHLSCHVKHVHSSERPFKCQACTSAFATKDRLRSHMIRHEGKVTCNICGKMLSAAYITSHLKTHGQTNFNNSCNKVKLYLKVVRTSGLELKGMESERASDLINQSSHLSNFLIPDNTDVCHSGTVTSVSMSAPVTTQMSRGNAGTAVTIGAQVNLSTTVNTVNITSAPVSLQHPVTITGPVNIASVNIPATASAMNIAHPVAITTPMPMNIGGPLNIAMRPMDSMSFLSQVLPSSPPW